MEEKILKAMENAGLTHRGYIPEDPVALRMIEGLKPTQFYQELFRVVNPLFHPRLEYFVDGNKIKIKVNHSISPQTLEIGSIQNSPSSPLRVVSARISDLDIMYENGKLLTPNRKSYFDGNGQFVLGKLDFEHTSYLGTASLFAEVAKIILEG